MSPSLPLPVSLPLPSLPAAEVDPRDDAVAGEPEDGQHAAGHAEQARGIPRLPPQPEAAEARGEGEARDHLQHAADAPQAEQPARLHAHRGQDGVRECRHDRRLRNLAIFFLLYLLRTNCFFFVLLFIFIFLFSMKPVQGMSKRSGRFPKWALSIAL